MNTERINELKEFTDEFNKKLEEAYKIHEEQENTIEKKTLRTTAARSSRRATSRENIFSEPPSWKPTNSSGNYFDGFRRLENKYEMNDWEIYRINLVKRSYIKQTELKTKDFVPSAMVGKEFSLNAEKDTNTLSQTGKEIIQKFKKDNEQRIQSLRKKEEELHKLKHSKREVQWNNWKPSNHVIEEFSRPPGDKIHTYRKEKKKKFLIEDPFKPPKSNGDYFDKDIKRI